MTKQSKKKKRKLSKAAPAKRGYENEVDYIHKEGEFGDFEIRKTGSGWWGSQFNGHAKLEKFITASKLDMPKVRACCYAGLTEKQWDRFVDAHPEFGVLIPILRQDTTLAAHYNTAQSVRGNKEKNISPDLETSKWWLERRARGEFSTRQEFTGSDGKDLNEGLTDEQQEKIAQNVLKAVELRKKRKELQK